MTARKPAISLDAIVSVAALVLAAIGLPALADDAPPATAPAVTRSASGPAANPFDLGPATRKAIAALPQAASVEDGLKYDDDEKEILSAVKDHAHQLTDSGLYVLLRRAAAMPQLDARAAAILNQFSGATLIKSPEKFRGEPVHMTMRVYKMRKWTPGAEFMFNDRWPRDKPIWWLAGIEGAYSTKGAKRIVVLSIVDPTQALSPEVTPDANGDCIYENGRAVELAGIFYKTYADIPETMKGKDGPLQDYPVIVAWQLGEGLAGGFPWGVMVGVAALMVGVIIVLVYFGGRVKRSLKGGAGGGKRFQEFRHKRIEKIREAAMRDDDDKVEEVDQALKDAAAQFKKDAKD